MRVTLWLVLVLFFVFSISSTCLNRRKKGLVRFLKVAGNVTYVCATVSESISGDVRQRKMAGASDPFPSAPPIAAKTSRNSMQQLKTNGSLIIYSLIKNKFPFGMMKMTLSLLQVACRSPWASPSSLSLHAAGRCQPLLPSCRYTLQEGSVTLCSLLSKPNSMLGQAVCRKKEKKRAAQGHVIYIACMYAKPVFVSSICWVCWMCVCGDTCRDKQIQSARVGFVKVFQSFCKS